MATVHLGHTLTIAFATTSFTAEMTGLTWDGISRAAVETSHLATTAASSATLSNRTFLPGKLIDPGSIGLEMHFNPATNPPITEAAETVTVSWSLAGAETVAGTWAAQGFMTDFAIQNISSDEKMLATATVKLTGTVTMTDAS